MGKDIKAILEKNCNINLPAGIFKQLKNISFHTILIMSFIIGQCNSETVGRIGKMANTSRRSRRKQRISLITNIIFCLITLTALTGRIILVLQNYGLKNESRQVMSQLEEYEEREAEFVYSQADLDAYTAEAAELAKESREQEILAELKLRMESGDSTAETLRDFYPEDVVVYSDGRFFFFRFWTV